MKRMWMVALSVFLVSFLSGSASAKPYRGAEYRTIATMTYGRFEVRMRSAQVSGMLASFFTYYDPASPWNEIDIETLGRYSNETQFTTIVPTQNDTHVQRQTLAFNPHAAFHVYAIEWTPDYVAWQADGVEVYRQTGAHIAQIVKPQKLMMNIWQPAYVDWVGTFNPANLPVYAYYDWVKYYAYTPGTGDIFTLQWTDDFTSFDPLRWQKATHTWDGNNSQFVQENVVFSNGYMILCLTDSAHSGYAGGAVVDADSDPPYLISARASYGYVRVLFSELLDKASAETPGNYIIPGAIVQGASLLPDGRTVVLNVTGLNLSGSQTLIVVNVKDTAGNAMGAKSTKVIMPLSFPIKVDVGGGGSNGYLADSVWNFSQQYGGVGGTIIQAAPTLDIAGTSEDSVFRSALEGLSFYNVRVPTDRTVQVTLLLVETKYQEAGKRVFDVTLNGLQTMRIDLYQQTGYNTAWLPQFTGIGAPDGLITLRFTPVADKPVLSGIIVQSLVDGVGEGKSEHVIPPLGFNVFPNPLNGTANFAFSLPRGGDVAIEIFDLLGRRVSALPLGYRESGEQMFRWNTQNLASGVYLCSLIAGEQSLTRRLLLVR
jgi:beta-glucanase (GH16 family)